MKKLLVSILILLFIPIVFSFSSVNIASGSGGGGSVTNNNYYNVTNITGGNVTGVGFSGSFAYWTNATNLDYSLLFLSGSNIGIGTSTPNQKLQVNGSINATTYYGDGSQLTGISTGSSKLPVQFYNPMNYMIKTEFESVTAGYVIPWIPTAIASGTTALGSVEQQLTFGGVANMSTSATASSGYCYQITNALTYYLTNDTYATHIIKPYARTFATSNYTRIRAGFQDVFTVGLPVDGAYWNFTQVAGSTTQFTARAQVVNNSYQVNGTPFTTTFNNWYKADVSIINQTLAVFTLYNLTNGLILNQQNITSRIPTQDGRQTSHAVCGYTIGVSTAVPTMAIDFMAVYNNGTLIR